MDRTILGGILMAVGAVIAVFFLLPDPIGVTIGTVASDGKRHSE
jgi:hypothetical protein